jgi:energy-coupling factor transporter transmembrane protein EcfT
MAYRLTPYSYRPGETFLHRLNAGVKLLCLFAVSLISFFSIYGTAAAAALIARASLSANIRPHELLRGSKAILVMALLTVLLRALRFDYGLIEFSYSGFASGLLFAARIIISFSAGALLFSVTSMMELRAALESAETALRLFFIVILKKTPGAKTFARRLEKKRLSALSLSLSLMLGFIPRFFEVWENSDTAYRARSGKKGIAKLFILIPIVTARMIETAMETATALEARGILLERE